MDKRKKRVNWSDLEIRYFLKIMRDKNILDMLAEKGHRNAEIFKLVEKELRKKGFLKNLLQIRTKWKALKVQYYKIKRANSISASDHSDCPFWNELDEMLGNRPRGVFKHGTIGNKEVDKHGTIGNKEVVKHRAIGTLGVNEHGAIKIKDEVEEEVVEKHGAIEIKEEVEEEVFDKHGAIEIKEERVESSHVLLGLAETEYSDEDVDTPEAASESEPNAGSSKEHEPERELGPVRKKKKVVTKGSYSEALKSLSKEIKESQKEIANMFLEKQAEMLAKEMEEQRRWERQLLEEDRMATERMMTNLMSSFFQNLRQVYQPPVPVPFPSPDPSPPQAPPSPD